MQPHSNIASGRRISTSSNASSSVSMLSMATRSHRSSLYWLNPESLEKHADITLVAQSSPGDRRKMGAPAALLGAVSPYLRRLLANSWDQALDLVVHLDCTSSTLQRLIQLCMGQDVTSTNELLDWLKLLEVTVQTLPFNCIFVDIISVFPEKKYEIELKRNFRCILMKPLNSRSRRIPNVPCLMIRKGIKK